MTTIPNQLKITINTSVSGYQNIEYKPYMTFPEISKDDKKIMFDPLVKLNKNYVDQVPEKLRKKQFFNEGLFNSLVNFTNGQQAKSLIEATRKGYIDNNIKITLDTIFPENSVIYINKKPYVIADVQWTSGNWKIDTKIKPVELDSSKITNPYLYQTIIKDEIISGEKQIQSLPPVIIYGDNFTGSKNDTNNENKSSSASGIPKNSTNVTPRQNGNNDDTNDNNNDLLQRVSSMPPPKPPKPSLQIQSSPPPKPPKPSSPITSLPITSLPMPSSPPPKPPKPSLSTKQLNQEGGINYRPNNRYLAQNMIKKEKDNSQIAYYITIDMELRPGTSLTSEEIKNAKCNRKLNSIKKDWSGLTGAPYSIRPLYIQQNHRGGNKTRHKRILLQNNVKKKRLTKKNKRNINKKYKI